MINYTKLRLAKFNNYDFQRGFGVLGFWGFVVVNCDDFDELTL